MGICIPCLIYSITMLFDSKPPRPGVWNRGDKIHYSDVRSERPKRPGNPKKKRSDLRSTSVQTAVNVDHQNMSLSEADIIKSDINTSEISTVDPSNILECLPIGSKLHLPQKLTTNISSVRRNIGVEGIVAIGRLAFPDPP